jgi:hypothetical protein
VSATGTGTAFTYHEPFLCPEPPPPSSFTDIDGSFAEAEIACLEDAGLVSGTAPGVYSPDKVVTRAQMAVFLMNAYEAATGKPYTGPTLDPFTDIDGSFAEARIQQLVALGITAGTTATTYSPESPVTRAQMAVFLVRLYEELGGPAIVTGPVAFTDIAGNFAETRVVQLVALGVTAGTTPTMYGPDAAVTREQMAVFIVRVLEAVT